jgi:predicted RNase H-like HicB family nuclease
MGYTMRHRSKIKIIIEKHKDGYVGYPIGLKGVVVGEGESYDEALHDTRSAIRFHIESFGKNAFYDDVEILEAFVAEAEVF